MVNSKRCSSFAQAYKGAYDGIRQIFSTTSQPVTCHMLEYEKAGWTCEMSTDAALLGNSIKNAQPYCKVTSRATYASMPPSTSRPVKQVLKSSKGQSKRQDFFEALRALTNSKNQQQHANKRRASSTSKISVSEKHKVDTRADIVRSVEENFTMLYGLHTNAEKAKECRPSAPLLQRSNCRDRSLSLFTRRSSRSPPSSDTEIMSQERQAPINMHAEVLMSETSQVVKRKSVPMIPLDFTLKVATTSDGVCSLSSKELAPACSAAKSKDRDGAINHEALRASEPVLREWHARASQHALLPPRRTSHRARLKSDDILFKTHLQDCRDGRGHYSDGQETVPRDLQRRTNKDKTEYKTEVKRKLSAPLGGIDPGPADLRMNSITTHGNDASIGCRDAFATASLINRSSTSTQSSFSPYCNDEDGQPHFDFSKSSLRVIPEFARSERNVSIPAGNKANLRSPRSIRRPRTASESECGSIPPVPNIPAKYVMSTPPSQSLGSGLHSAPLRRGDSDGIIQFHNARERLSHDSCRKDKQAFETDYTPPSPARAEDDESSVCLATPTFGYVASFVTAPCSTPRVEEQPSFAVLQNKSFVAEKPRFTRPQFRPMSAGSNATSTGFSSFDTSAFNDTLHDQARLFVHRLPLRSVSPKTVPEEEDYACVTATETLKEWQRRLEEARRPSGVELKHGLSHVKLALAERTHTLRQKSPECMNGLLEQRVDDLRHTFVAQSKLVAGESKTLKPAPRRSSLSQQALAAWQHRSNSLRVCKT